MALSSAGGYSGVGHCVPPGIHSQACRSRDRNDIRRVAAAAIAHVEVSVGGGSWQGARLVTERQRHGWQWWELITRVEEPGLVTLRARATDLAGRTQPERAEWNRLGYGNNSIHQVPVRIA